MVRRPALLLLLLLVAAAAITTTVAFRSLHPTQQPRQRQRRIGRAAIVMGAERAPTGLSLDDVSSKLKFEVTDLDEGIYGLDSKVRVAMLGVVMLLSCVEQAK